jgi:hypothetical protein
MWVERGNTRAHHWRHGGLRKGRHGGLLRNIVAVVLSPLTLVVVVALIGVVWCPVSVVLVVVAGSLRGVLLTGLVLRPASRFHALLRSWHVPVLLIMLPRLLLLRLLLLGLLLLHLLMLLLVLVLMLMLLMMLLVLVLVLVLVMLMHTVERLRLGVLLGRRLLQVLGVERSRLNGRLRRSCCRCETRRLVAKEACSHR